MDASKLPRGQSAERNPDGRPINLPGIYTHKPTGREFITNAGRQGVQQADALMTPHWKDQWERTGDVPSRVELLKRNKAQEVKDKTAEAVEKGKEAAELKEATKAALKTAEPKMAQATA